jgi:methyl-accepting chemotaxis protein
MLAFRIGLSHKIIATGAVGILGLLLVAGVYFVGARSLAHYQDVADQADAIGVVTDKVSAEILELRRSEKDFLLSSDDKHVRRVGDLTKSVLVNLELLKEKLAAADQVELVGKTDALRSAFETYTRQFVALIDAKRKLGLDQNSGLEGALRASVGAIENELEKFDDQRLTVMMLLMRRNEKDFMLRRDMKFGEEMKKAGEEAALAIRIASMPASTKEGMSQKLAAYQRDFVAYMAATQVVMRAEAAMAEAIAKIEPQIAAVQQSVDSVASEARAAAATSRDATTFRIQIALLTIMIAVGGLSFLIGRSVSKPLIAMTAAMKELGAGNFSVVLPGLGRKDEIGDIASAVESFKLKAEEKAKLEADETLRRQAAEAELAAKAAEERAKASAEQTRVVESLAEGLRNLSDGNLTFRLPDDFPDAYKQIRDDFNSAIGGLQETIAAIASAAREVASAAGEISSGTTNLSQRTEEQAASLEQTSASMEQISVTVKNNAENARQANEFTQGTREVGNRGGDVVAKAVGAMSRIEESSRKISDIISVIDEIARQTNLLALNAAVEAARAGEAGRGFAVVASEVRSLAQRSSQAAKDIKELITNSSGQVREGVDLVNRAGTSLNEIVASIEKVSEIVSGIATASTEQATGIDEINRALAQMDEATQQNSALVEENAAAAKTLQQQSHAMDERVSFFRLGNGADVGAAPRVASPAPAAPATKAPPAAAAKQPVAPKPAAPAAAPSKRPVAAAGTRPAAAPPPRGARPMQAALAAAVHDDDWAEF